MSCYVYMLKSLKNGKYYVGISENVFRRLKEHNSGKLKTTSVNKPYKIVFKKEYIGYKEARKHEIWLKKKSVKYKDKVSQRGGSAACPA
jgi:putative endonuclease